LWAQEEEGALLESQYRRGLWKSSPGNQKDLQIAEEQFYLAESQALRGLRPGPAIFLSYPEFPGPDPIPSNGIFGLPRRTPVYLLGGEGYDATVAPTSPVPDQQYPTDDQLSDPESDLEKGLFMKFNDKSKK